MKNDDLTSFGKKMRQARERAGMSQEELGARTGLHRTYIGSVERGERNVGLINVLRIARCLGIPPSSLFDDEATENEAGDNAEHK